MSNSSISKRWGRFKIIALSILRFEASKADDVRVSMESLLLPYVILKIVDKKCGESENSISYGSWLTSGVIILIGGASLRFDFRLIVLINPIPCYAFNMHLATVDNNVPIQ